MPKRIVVREFGGPETLKWESFDLDRSSFGKILVQVTHIGVNRADILLREGKYHEKTLPAVPGFEASGYVLEGSKNLKKGDKVLIYRRSTGLYATQVLVQEVDLFKIPDDFPLDIAASIPINWLTAYELMFHRCGLKKDESILILAASSGVGQAAIQLALHHGVQTFGFVSSPEKAKILKDSYGCDVRYGSVSDILSLFNRRFDVVLDLVGGSLFRSALLLASDGGRLGQAANVTLEDSTINVRDFYPRNISIHGFQYGNSLAIGKHSFEKSLNHIIHDFSKGFYKSTISKIFNIQNAAEAHQCLQTRSHTGKIILNAGEQ